MDDGRPDAPTPAGPTTPAAAATPVPPVPAKDPRRFLVKGWVDRLPRRRADRDMLLAWVAHQVLELEEPTTELRLTRRLGELARDPVGIRRELVDAGLVTRTRDGAEYWRTRVTEFDDLS